ncbi:MAG: endonuclease [Elainellaceae cyanobacterium]
MTWVNLMAIALFALAVALPAPAAAQTVVRIHDIQGAAHTSPLAGETVSEVRGIVTSVKDKGFYLQDPVPDDDEATSEGIFVFTKTVPAAGETLINEGDLLLVSGRVIEFTPGGQNSNNLSTTQIDATAADSLLVVSTGNPLPAATVIGEGGRIPPNQVIEDDNFSSFDPDVEGMDFYESLEAMRVQVNDAVAVSERDRFGQIFVVGDRGANASVVAKNGGLVIQANDFNPERILIDNQVGRTPRVHVGDRFTGPIVGVMDYGFSSYRLRTTQPLPEDVASETLPERTGLTATADQLTVATFNVENLDPGDNQRFGPLASIVVEHLKSPDILALVEVQDNDGPTDSSVTAADETYARLISAIETAGGPKYRFIDVPPQDDKDGGQPGGNIRVGFLYGDRVSLADAPKGSATDNASVTRSGSGVHLAQNPSRIGVGKRGFENARKSAVAEFEFNGQPIFVVANHFKSKRGDGPLFGKKQPPERVTETQRLNQAKAVHEFVETLLDADARANIVVLGDLNDYAFSSPVQVLEGNVLQNLDSFLPVNDRYTALFEGNLQALDHILASQHLLFEGNAEIDIVHVSVGLPNGLSDHDPLVSRYTLPQVVGAAPRTPASPAESLPEPTTQPVTDPSAGPTIVSPAPPPPILQNANTSSEPAESSLGRNERSPRGQSLLDELARLFTPKKTLGYARARDLLYGSIDNKDGVLAGAYTGYEIRLNPRSAKPRSEAFSKGINAEHVWPQSRGAQGPAKSDLHHLFPTRVNVNSTRGNNPFADIPDASTTRWFRDDDQQRSIPSSGIDEYSEFRTGVFEPREEVKGNVARAMFYFYTIYESQADDRFFKQQQSTLCEWDKLDPPDATEVARSGAIAQVQGNENPFVLDTTLAERTYCQ